MQAVTVDMVKFGSYREFSGPYWPGSKRFALPENPNFAWRVLSVLTATETKGLVDPVNMYDRMIISISPIQWGDAGQFSVTNILGLVAERDPEALFELQPALAQANAGFEKNDKGLWRFKFQDDRGWVDTIPKQQDLYLSTDGKTGSWGQAKDVAKGIPDSPQRIYAKTWAACVASVFHHDKAIGAMFDYTLPRLFGFALDPAKSDLFVGMTEDDEQGFEGALRAMYISYAGNNPKKASDLYKSVRNTTSWSGLSTFDKFFLLAKVCATKGFDIWGQRYNDIAPALEKAFDIDLPKKWQDL